MTVKGLRSNQLDYRAALWVNVVTALSLAALLGCSFRDRPAPRSSVVQSRDVINFMQVSDEQLMSLVTNIAAGSDKTSSDALNTLTTYPIERLADRLQKVLRTMTDDDHRRVSVAFVLCLLNHGYENNKNVIVRELRKEPHHKNLYADWEAELVHRLILRGDSSLLPTLFEASTWSDGAMSASLSGYLTYHLRNQAEQFLDELRREPTETRRAVYKRILVDEMLTKEELASILRNLESIQQTSPIFDVAREMLFTLRKHQ